MKYHKQRRIIGGRGMRELPQLIKTERLILRPYRAADASRVVAILSNLDVSRWLSSVPHPFTVDDLRLFIPEGKSRWPNIAAITLKGEFIGAVGTGGGLGYWLAPANWGHGFASEACAALIDFFFAHTTRDHLTSDYFYGNTASANVLGKLGFVKVAKGTRFCTALGCDLPHVSLVLTRRAWNVF